MFAVIMLTYAALHCVLFMESFRWADNSQWRIWFLRLMLLAMAYDNLFQGLGNTYIDRDWFEPLNYPRYYLHVLVLPFLTLFTVSIMRSAQISFASSRLFSAVCLVVVVAALGYGIVHELVDLQLAPKETMGMTRLNKVDGSVPWATIGTNLLMLPLAAIVWKVSGWKWLFLGALFIFLLNGATGAQPWGFAAGNFAELVFIFALLATEKRFAGVHSYRAPAGANV